MLKIKLIGAKSVRMEDFSDFDVESGFELVDILNDGLYENTKHTFLTAPGSFLYELSINVDMKKAAELGVGSFEIEVYDKKPIIPSKKNDDPLSRSKDLKAQFNVKKELIDNLFATSIAKARIDLGITNAQRASVKTGNVPADLIYEDTLRLSDPVICQNDSYSNPIIVNSIKSAAIVTRQNGSLMSAKEMQRENLQRFSIDPGKTNDFFEKIYPTLSETVNSSIALYEQDGGSNLPVTLNPKTYSKLPISLRNLRIKLSKEKNAEFSNPFAKQAAMAVTQLNLKNANTKIFKFKNGSVSRLNDSTKTIAHEIKVRSHYKTFKAIIEIPKNQDNGLLYLKLLPVLHEKSSIKINNVPTIHTIDHRENLNQILMPIFAPKIEKIQDSKGLISLRITQVDPSSTSVVLMRKVQTKDARNNDVFENLGEYNIEYHDSSIIFNDQNVSNIEPNIVTYRALTKYGDLIGPFNSIVFHGHPCVDSPIQHSEPNEVSIFATNELNWIKIDISEIPEKAISLTLYREDLQSIGSKFERTVVIRNERNEKTSMVLGINEKTFYDRTAILGRKYRYYCILTLLGGTQVETVDDENIIREYSTSEIPLHANLSNIQFETSRGVPTSVKMNLNVEFKDDSYQFIRNLLAKQGAESSYLAEFDKNRDEIKNAVLFRVERIDRRTGNRESLGTIVPGEFVDNEILSNKLNVSKLRPGGRYIYKFRMCLVPPSAFIDGVLESASTGKKPGFKDFQFQANKYKNPLISRSGILPSNAQLRRGFNPNLLILQADTGYSIQKEIELPLIKPVPADIKIKSNRNGSLITWGITEGTQNIDRFNIKLYLNGEVEFVFPSVAFGQTKRFYFVDQKFHNELGTRFYAITAVYSDGTESAEASSEPIDKFYDSNFVGAKMKKPNSFVAGISDSNPNIMKQVQNIAEIIKKL